jgi:hypothetical protein
VTASTALSAKCTKITGSLVIDADAKASMGSALSFPLLTSIGQDLTIDSPSGDINDISFPALSGAPMSIDFSASTWTGNLTFDALTDAIITNFTIELLLGRVELSAPKLSSCGSVFALGTPVVAYIALDLPALDTVVGGFFLSSGSPVTGSDVPGLSLPKLSSVYGDFLVTSGELNLETIYAPSLLQVAGVFAVALNPSLTNITVPSLAAVDSTFQVLLATLGEAKDEDSPMYLNARSLTRVGGVVNVQLMSSGVVRLPMLSEVQGKPASQPSDFNSTLSPVSFISIDGKGDLMLYQLDKVHAAYKNISLSLSTGEGEVSAPLVSVVGGDVDLFLPGATAIDFGTKAKIAGALSVSADKSLVSFSLDVGTVERGIDIDLNGTAPLNTSLAGISPSIRSGSIACAIIAPWACMDELDRLKKAMGGCNTVVGNASCTSCGRNDEPAFGIQVQCPAVDKCWFDGEKCTGSEIVDPKTCKCVAAGTPSPPPPPGPSPGPGPTGGHGFFSKTWHIVLVAVGATLCVLPALVLLVRRLRSSSSTAGYEQLP